MSDALCWGLLYHMLGMTDASREHLTRARDEDGSGLAAKVLAYEGTQGPIGFKIGDDPVAQTASAPVRLKEIVQLLETTFATRPGGLAFEGAAIRDASYVAGKAQDGCDGYSRDPFKDIEDPTHRDRIALAAVSYLLRSHALFFCRPRIHRGSNAAKTALNDLHQAYQLGWRLYHGLKVSHHARPMQSLEPYLDAVSEGQTEGVAPGDSAFFVWNLLLLAEIFRGNVYRHIDFLNEADRHYRHAQDRFDRLRQRVPNLVTKRFITPTLIRGLFERSKIRFDLGELLQSLQTQVGCVEYLVRSDLSTASLPGASDLLRTLQRISRFLEVESTFPTYDRQMITYCFGDPSASLPGWGSSEEKLDPKAVASYVPVALAPVAAEVFARIGFTLYTFCRGGIRGPTRAQADWLRNYCRFDEIWAQYSDREISPSRLGCYCETLLSRTPVVVDANLFHDQIERRFALLLRQSADARTVLGDGVDEKEFYRAILRSTTQNIGNLVTIPRRNQRMLMRRGYRYRRSSGDLSKKTVYEGLHAAMSPTGPVHDQSHLTELNKFVVLRRWQSFNPKIPRAGGVPVHGGGYYLMWHGKGFVVDPGYDFIQNFYDQGFSLEDIDAIVITHSHPDHDDDFASLMTLVKEWNEFHEMAGQGILIKRWDLFLNESAHKKFSSWLQAYDVKFGRIIPLPTLWWNKETAGPADGPFRGENVRLDLRTWYDLAIEVVPAWHDDVIGTTAAVGLKFHLYSKAGELLGVVGYTGDTGAYGWTLTEREDVPTSFDQPFLDCDVLIAHLGDIRLRELSSIMRAPSARSPNLPPEKHPLIELASGWLGEIRNDRAVDPQSVADRVRDLLYFAITLHLIPSEALQVTLPNSEGVPTALQDWLGEYIDSGGRKSPGIQQGWTLETGLKSLKERMKTDEDSTTTVVQELRQIEKIASGMRSVTADAINAYRLVRFAMACTLFSWKYPYHLGVFGIHRLFKNMVEKVRGEPRWGRIFVVGELPEELTSYRQVIACWLNVIQGNEPKKATKERPVHAFTGDTGLHIGLGNGTTRIEPTLRCAYCNYNNELVCRHENYHRPEHMRELAIKRQDASMIYLCTMSDHYPEDAEQPRHFLSSPERRTV